MTTQDFLQISRTAQVFDRAGFLKGMSEASTPAVLTGPVRYPPTLGSAQGTVAGCTFRQSGDHPDASVHDRRADSSRNSVTSGNLICLGDRGRIGNNTDTLHPPVEHEQGLPRGISLTRRLVDVSRIILDYQNPGVTRGCFNFPLTRRLRA